MKIPSLLLWDKVMRDSRVNSPFQKFKRHLLLLLQLLILLFLVLAAFQPYIMGQQYKGKFYPILIDVSASMGALKSGTSQTRLDIAKENVKKIIESHTDGQQIALLIFGNTARKVCSFTNNKRILLAALESITVEDVPSDVEDVLRMTQALSQNYKFSEVIMFSDGNIPKSINFDLPFRLNYQKIITKGENIGIMQFGARRAGEQNWQVYIQIAGTKDVKPTKINLFKDGKLFATDTIFLTEKEERVLFDVDGEDKTHLKVELQPTGEDVLNSDNIAYLNLPQIRPLRVYTPPDLLSAKLVLQGIAGITLKKNDTYDLELQTSKKTKRKAHIHVTFGFIPSPIKHILELKKGSSEIVDWERSSPLLEHVELDDLILNDIIVYKQKGNISELETLGYHTLIESKTGPLLLKRDWEGHISYHFLFNPEHSTLIYRIGYPIMLTNLVRIAMQESGLSEHKAKRTGVLPAMNVSPTKEYKITTPKGKVLSRKSDDDGTLLGITALHSGEYKIKGAGVDVNVGASLLSIKESLLDGIDKLQFKELSVKRSKSKKTPYPLWKYLALIAFLFLIFEWWYFQRPPNLNK
jgi:hypothetical protein